MPNRFVFIVTVVGVLVSLAPSGAQRRQRLNPVIDLLEQKKPVFGLYAPSNRRPGGRGAPGARPSTNAQGAPSPVEGRGATPTPAPAPAPEAPAKSPLDLAKEAVA